MHISCTVWHIAVSIWYVVYIISYSASLCRRRRDRKLVQVDSVILEVSLLRFLVPIPCCAAVGLVAMALKDSIEELEHAIALCLYTLVALVFPPLCGLSLLPLRKAKRWGVAAVLALGIVMFGVGLVEMALQLVGVVRALR